MQNGFRTIIKQSHDEQIFKIGRFATVSTFLQTVHGDYDTVQPVDLASVLLTERNE
jgi:hypothetical protein